MFKMNNEKLYFIHVQFMPMIACFDYIFQGICNQIILVSSSCFFLVNFTNDSYGKLIIKSKIPQKKAQLCSSNSRRTGSEVFGYIGEFCALSKSLNLSQFFIMKTTNRHVTMFAVLQGPHRRDISSCLTADDFCSLLMKHFIPQNESTAASLRKIPQMLPVQTGLEQFVFVVI